jgi:hypothetical protein
VSKRQKGVSCAAPRRSACILALELLPHELVATSLPPPLPSLFPPLSLFAYFLVHHGALFWFFSIASDPLRIWDLSGDLASSLPCL